MANQQSQPRFPGRKPTHRLYRVQGDGDAATWTPIGAAWPHKDGLGFSLACDAVPLTGRIVLRFIDPRRNGREAVTPSSFPLASEPASGAA